MAGAEQDDKEEPQTLSVEFESAEEARDQDIMWQRFDDAAKVAELDLDTYAYVSCKLVDSQGKEWDNYDDDPPPVGFDWDKLSFPVKVYGTYEYDASQDGLRRRSSSLAASAKLFEPGELGWSIDRNTACIEKVEKGSLASKQGVEVGWVVTLIDGAPYNFDLLKQKSCGAAQYTLGFKVPMKASSDKEKEKEKEEKPISLAKALRNKENRDVANKLAFFIVAMAVVPVVGLICCERFLRGFVENDNTRWTYSGVVAVVLVNLVIFSYVMMCFAEDRGTDAGALLKSANGKENDPNRNDAKKDK